MLQERLVQKDFQALRFLDRAIVREGRSPTVRELAQFLGYKSPRTAFLVLTKLVKQGWVRRKADGKLQMRKSFSEVEDHARTVEVPLIGSVACGRPFLAEQNIEAYIQVSISLAKPGNSYFLLRAVGDSMDDAGIHSGDLVLVRRQGHAENGDKVVALIDDEATIKEFFREKRGVLLKPKSKNKMNKPIILTESFMIQGVVTSVLPPLSRDSLSDPMRTSVA